MDTVDEPAGREPAGTAVPEAVEPALALADLPVPRTASRGYRRCDEDIGRYVTGPQIRRVTERPVPGPTPAGTAGRP